MQVMFRGLRRPTSLFHDGRRIADEVIHIQRIFIDAVPGVVGLGFEDGLADDQLAPTEGAGEKTLAQESRAVIQRQSAR